MGFTGATAGGVLAGIAGNVIPTPGASEEEAETMTFSEKMDRVKTVSQAAVVLRSIFDTFPQYVNNFFFEPMRDKLLPDFEVDSSSMQACLSFLLEWTGNLFL